MSFNEFTLVIIDFIKTNEIWAMPVIFLLAFGESLAFISLLLPATFILLAIGGLAGQSDIAFIPIWLAAILGAILGDWLSFWLGFHYKEKAERIWPLTRYPEILKKGYTFFHRWGVLSVFLGRFFGPFRAVVPLIAGICQMRLATFQLANVSSAFVWATGILAPGMFGIPWLTSIFS